MPTDMHSLLEPTYRPQIVEYFEGCHIEPTVNNIDGRPQPYAGRRRTAFNPWAYRAVYYAPYLSYLGTLSTYNTVTMLSDDCLVRLLHPRHATGSSIKVVGQFISPPEMVVLAEDPVPNERPVKITISINVFREGSIYSGLI